MKNILGFGLAAVTILGLGACGKNEEQAAKNVTNDKVSSLGLMATYNGDCANIPLDPLGLHASKTAYDITGSITKTVTYYNTDDCKGGSEVLQIKSTGKYENVDTIAELPNVGKIDITYTKSEVVPRTDLLRDSMNKLGGAGYCGVNDWATGGARDVSSQSGNATCLGTEKLNVTSYDLISTQNGQLKFGESNIVPGALGGNDKSTPEKRPKQLSSTVSGRKG